MSVFYPNSYFNNIYSISPDFFKKHGFKGIILDIDDTLVPHGYLDPPKELEDWLLKLKKDGIKFVAVSNNKKNRVGAFCKKLDLTFFYLSVKPLPFGYFKARKHLELKSTEICAIGDQIFTDILGANLCGIYSILVKPLSNKKGFTLNIKRLFEKKILKKYFSNYKG